MNDYQGQIRALDQDGHTFSANQNIYSLIQQDAVSSIKYIKKISITAPEGTRMRLNRRQIHIGKTGIYEAGDLQITSFIFLEDTSSDVIIDFIVEI